MSEHSRGCTRIYLNGYHLFPCCYAGTRREREARHHLLRVDITWTAVKFTKNKLGEGQIELTKNDAVRAHM